MPERDGSYGNCLRGWLADRKSGGDIICVKGWRGRYGIVARLSLLRSRENAAALRLSPYASFSGAEGRFKVSPIGRVDSSSSIVLEFFRFRLFISRGSKGKLEERKNSCRLYYVESLARKKNIYIYIYFFHYSHPLESEGRSSDGNRSFHLSWRYSITLDPCQAFHLSFQ